MSFLPLRRGVPHTKRSCEMAFSLKATSLTGLCRCRMGLLLLVGVVLRLGHVNRVGLKDRAGDIKDDVVAIEAVVVHSRKADRPLILLIVCCCVVGLWLREVMLSAI